VSDGRFELVLNRVLTLMVLPVQLMAPSIGFLWRNATKLTALVALVVTIRHMG
jgi:hypothetical protein